MTALDAEVAVAVSGAVEDLLAAGRAACFEVVSASMWPWIRPGDEVSVARCEPADLRLGDVVALRGADRVLVHRFLGLRSGGTLLVTRGDATLSVDEPQPVDRLLGRVETMRRPGGRRRDLRCRRWRAAARMAGAMGQGAALAQYLLNRGRAAVKRTG